MTELLNRPISFLFHLLLGWTFLAGGAQTGWAQSATAAANGFDFRFDATARVWTLSNGALQAILELDQNGRFSLRQVALTGGTARAGWFAPEFMDSSPIDIHTNLGGYDAQTAFVLVAQRVDEPSPTMRRQIIELEDFDRTARFTLEIEMYRDQAVLRHHVAFTNLRAEPVFVTGTDLMPYVFASPDAYQGGPNSTLELFRVAQWSAGSGNNFETSTVALEPGSPAVPILTGAHGDHCSWFALRDELHAGLFAGWEFDGRVNSSVERFARHIALSAQIKSMHHPVEPNTAFDLPWSFLGVYSGDWDEAGYRTQRFVEAAIAQPAPAGFPYASWDSWAYQTAITEQNLRSSADAAARMGIELFVVDLGWARQIGDWTEDPAKFPSGLRALSDYVHSKGMKFGLHFALAEIASDSPIFQEHPEWVSTEQASYFGALSLCLSNKPARDWVIAQALHLIDDYGVDYLLQDGENMVKLCTRKDHTHDSEDSNFSNAVDGINAVIGEVQRLRPNVLWENCENGGNMMTFSMVSHYVTSITNDASGASDARKAVWGATFPFSPRYATTYMPEDPTNTYITRSYVFGGPWHFMNRLDKMTAETEAFATDEIATFKRVREVSNHSKVFHREGNPALGQIDVLQGYNPATDSAVAVLTRASGPEDSLVLRPQGLRTRGTYQVRFEDDARTLTMTGEQLSTDGLRVELPRPYMGVVVYIRPLRTVNPRR